MADKLSRRELTRRILAGSSAAAAVSLNGCTGSSTSTNSNQIKPSDRDKLLAQGAAAAAPLQIICHGMMGFHFMTASSPPIIRIYVPDITGHVYKAGANATSQKTLHPLTRSATYKLNPLIAGNKTPFNVFRTPNVILRPSVACSCSPNPPGKAPYCIIDIPMADDYEGYRMAVYSGSGTIFKGTTAMQCGLNLTTIPLVHVFRYTSINTASLAEPATTASVWDSSKEGAKFHIFAEPDHIMPKDDAHLSDFDTMFNPALDLHFTDPANLTFLDDPGDNLISSVDLSSLPEIPVRSGNPTNCMGLFIIP